jgi:hypothetical protein
VYAFLMAWHDIDGAGGFGGFFGVSLPPFGAAWWLLYA